MGFDEKLMQKTCHFFKSILFLGTRISNTTAPRKSFSDSILKNRIFSPGYVPYNYFSSISSSVSCLVPTLLARSPVINQTRSVTKWSLNKGKRKSVKAVTQRFYRLQWGAWIRPMVGNHKRHWSKTAKKKSEARSTSSATLPNRHFSTKWSPNSG